MKKRRSKSLFNLIAPVYNLFYSKQKRRFIQVVESAKKILDLTSFETILDVGCGTGALCSVLNSKGIKVTGVDLAEKMLDIAKNKPENKAINFVHGSALKKLPFDDKSFDVSIASYVVHGMQKNERRMMYAEMSRVTKAKVIIYDYNKNRSILTTIIECLERGDYFNFISSGESEMKECFQSVQVIDVSTRAAWYICTLD